MNITIYQALSSLQIGRQVTFRNLTAFPLLNPTGTVPGYLTLDEALQQGRTRITEVSAGGNVPELRVVNDSSMPVLLLDGEELIGALQNRVLNLTLLVPATTALTVPVSCVESGRWSQQSPEFAAAPRTQYAAGRMQKMEQVSKSLRTGGERRSDQNAVWNDIAEKSRRFEAQSETGAMSAIYEQNTENIEAYAQEFAPLADQVGASYAINGRFVGFELFDSVTTFATLQPKLVRSYALDALDRLGEVQVLPSLWSAESLLNAASRVEVDEHRAIGLGEDVRLSGNGLVGAALVVDEQVIHLSVFHQGV